MATTKVNVSKISDFPKVATLTGSEQILVEKDGQGGSITLSQIPVPDSVEDRIKGLNDRIDNLVPFFFGAAPDINGPFLLFEPRVSANKSVNLILSKSGDAPVIIDDGDELFFVTNMMETSVNEYTII